MQIEVCGVPFRAVRTRRPPLIRQPMGVKQLVVLAPIGTGSMISTLKSFLIFAAPKPIGGKSWGRFTASTRKRCPLF